MEVNNMADAIHKEILKTISVLMTTAFAFVAGSAWNDAIQTLIQDFVCYIHKYSDQNLLEERQQAK